MTACFSIEQDILLDANTISTMVEVVTPEGTRGIDAAIAFPQHIHLGKAPFYELRLKMHVFTMAWVPPSHTKDPWLEYCAFFAEKMSKITLSNVLLSSDIMLERTEGVDYPGIWPETPTGMPPFRRDRLTNLAQDFFDREARQAEVITRAHTRADVPAQETCRLTAESVKARATPGSIESEVTAAAVTPVEFDNDDVPSVLSDLTEASEAPAAEASPLSPGTRKTVTFEMPDRDA